MKKIVSIALGLFAFTSTFSQAQNPVTWKATYKQLSASEGEIIISAQVEKGWHTYSQRPTDAGPISTSFTFAPSKHYQLIGKTEETGVHEEFDVAFDAKLFVITDKAEFTQKIKISGKTGFSIPLKAEFVCCSDKMCLPPKVMELSVKVQ
jgi:hypothetical protein